jgi:ankyrin repeat protein
MNARDKYLLTPLHYAVARNNLFGVKQLLTYNVNIDVSVSDTHRVSIVLVRR